MISNEWQTEWMCALFTNLAYIRINRHNQLSLTSCIHGNRARASIFYNIPPHLDSNMPPCSVCNRHAKNIALPCCQKFSKLCISNGSFFSSGSVTGLIVSHCCPYPCLSWWSMFVLSRFRFPKLDWLWLVSPGAPPSRYSRMSGFKSPCLQLHFLFPLWSTFL